MSKTAVVYWSMTGNTESMAKAVAEGAGANAELFNVSDFDKSRVDEFDAFALGCPAMGDEVLEDGEFEPFFEAVKDKLAGKKVALFGSYGWGDGQWMRDWEKSCNDAGITLATSSVICNDAPGEDELEQCRALGASLN
ncbi:MAG: flavodoxin [Oscillospiraceae bacterium]|nr:flavodoxin [Oscillospiraceae bacterium]